MIRDDLVRDIRINVSNCIDFRREASDDEVMSLIEDKVLEASETIMISLSEKVEITKKIFNSMRRLDILQPLLEDPTVTEIMINGPKNIFIERAGRIHRLDSQFQSVEVLENIIQSIVSKVNRTVNESSPIVDSRLKEGYRVNVVLAPIALNGPILTIRKFPSEPMTMDRLLGLGALTEEAAILLEKMVKAKFNIFVSGGTGSGKTSFLNALTDFIPKDERIITIEDSAELQIKGVDNLVRLETRNVNSEGRGEISIRDLIKASLRMRPERIIVGEVRGPEALDMLSAMNTGHDGSLSSGHANSPKDMLSRLETMVLCGAQLPIEAIRQQIASAIDIIVHLGRLRDKSRKVIEICEVNKNMDGDIRLNTLFKFKEFGENDRVVLGELVRTNERIVNDEKFRISGIKGEI